MSLGSRIFSGRGGGQGKSRGPPGAITWAPRGNHVGTQGQSRGPPGEITWAPRGNHVGHLGPNVSVLHIRWPKYWSFNFSISPSSEYSGLISFRIAASTGLIPGRGTKIPQAELYGQKPTMSNASLTCHSRLTNKCKEC